MKTVFKVFGKLIKWYAILDIMCLAFMGYARYLDTIKEYPHLSTYDTIQEAWATSINSVRQFFNI